ncbi:NlpC/P60 family protein [Streptomyces genisteinicus]|uniref:C40 family peptidase n=1 Tax=Streptomyces genisteinicus TaxID=2768068 RepID=A0A7H0I4Q0_9ACTN|nr:NlpC/P60 family protein [Streptomyces genisteinicus]QNP67766.1 C40 family peptidase [Streptomyces genisteinicus]
MAAGPNRSARGPAQFVDGTWATYRNDADGNGRVDPFDVGDAVTAQGRYMCSLLGDAKASGLKDDVRRLALAGYNANWGAVEHYRGVPPKSFSDGQTFYYVKDIMEMMKDYEGAPLLNVGGSGASSQALRRAAARIGTPYAYGGGPAGPGRGNGYVRGRYVASSTVGFDCSRLGQYAYWPHTQLPRTAAAQYQATAHRPVTRGEIRLGDLLFWARRNAFIYHVGLYAGDGRVLHAPRTGRRSKWSHSTPPCRPATTAGPLGSEERGPEPTLRPFPQPVSLSPPQRASYASA